MDDFFYIYSKNVKHRKDAFFAFATIFVTPPAKFEYIAFIEDGDKPAPYIDGFNIITPPGRSCTIVRKTKTLQDAIDQLQEIADKYGTLCGCASVNIMPSDDKDDEDE